MAAVAQNRSDGATYFVDSILWELLGRGSQSTADWRTLRGVARVENASERGGEGRSSKPRFFVQALPSTTTPLFILGSETAGSSRGFLRTGQKRSDNSFQIAEGEAHAKNMVVEQI